MNFKISTREKFTIITPVLDFSSDTLTAEFIKLCTAALHDKKNVIINFKNVQYINERLLNELAALHKQFYNNNLSFVICEIQSYVQTQKNKINSGIQLNTTPSESEAYDMVQMEEIERELFNDEEGFLSNNETDGDH